MVKSSDFFNAPYFKAYFHENLMAKKGGGRDGLTPKTFIKEYEKTFDHIAKRCLDGTYRFSPYKEKLLLKGRNKYPRILSIPSMRDRMVLGVLNKYLQAVFPDAIPHNVPNQYIGDVCSFLSANASQTIYFLKTDIKSFYDELDLDLLYGILSEKVEREMLSLVRNAIETATVSGCEKSRKRSVPIEKGVPQGLAISNMLASIYMLSFDNSMKGHMHESTMYKRYVDDILILNSNGIIDENYVRLISKQLYEDCKSLMLSEEKRKKELLELWM